MTARYEEIADSELVHAVTATPNNSHDVTQANAQIHRDEQDICFESWFQGTREREVARNDIRWSIAMHSSKCKALDRQLLEYPLSDQVETIDTRICAKVQHQSHTSFAS